MSRTRSIPRKARHLRATATICTILTTTAAMPTTGRPRRRQRFPAAGPGRPPRAGAADGHDRGRRPSWGCRPACLWTRRCRLRRRLRSSLRMRRRPWGAAVREVQKIPRRRRQQPRRPPRRSGRRPRPLPNTRARRDRRRILREITSRTSPIRAGAARPAAEAAATGPAETMVEDRARTGIRAEEEVEGVVAKALLTDSRTGPVEEAGTTAEATNEVIRRRTGSSSTEGIEAGTCTRRTTMAGTEVALHPPVQVRRNQRLRGPPTNKTTTAGTAATLPHRARAILARAAAEAGAS